MADPAGAVTCGCSAGDGVDWVGSDNGDFFLLKRLALFRYFMYLRIALSDAYLLNTTSEGI
jgi:hypothetical protein